METGKIIGHEEGIAEINRLPLISWGSVLAGLVFVMALSWLLYLLGMAIGVSVADLADMKSIGEGFGIGAVIWIILTSMIVYFLGAMLTARLANKHDTATGMLHGVTLWGITTILVLILSYIGVAGLLQTGQSIFSSATSAVVNTASALGSGASNTAEALSRNVTEAADSKIVNNLQAKLKRQAARIIASADPKGGVDVSQKDVRETIEQLDEDVLQKLAGQLVEGKTEQAKDTLSNNSGFTERQIEALVENFSNESQEMMGTAENDQGLVADIQNQTKQRLARFLEELEASGGPDISSQEMRRVMEQIDMQTLQSVAMQLIRGDVEGAKNVLTVNTSLSDAQVNDLVTGVNREVEKTISDYKQEIDSTVEAVSSYSQAVLWAVFSASAIGLLLAILGGSMGADTAKRLYISSRRSYDRELSAEHIIK